MALRTARILNRPGRKALAQDHRGLGYVSESSTINTFINILASPAEAFRSINEKPRFLWAWLLIVSSTAMVQSIYMYSVDIEWFFEQQILASQPDLTEAQIEDTVGLISSFPQWAISSFTLVSTAIFFTGIFLVQALYFRIVSAITKDGLLYSKCFSLVCWASLPTVLSSLAQVVKLSTSDVSLLPITEINPLAFAAMLDIDPVGTGTLDQIVMNFDLTTVWSLVLLIIGYKIFSGKDVVTAALIAAMPTAIIVALAFAF